MNIGKNIKAITGMLPNEVKLVAVSKTKPDEDLLEAYNAGQRVFGENKTQELTGKHERLPKDIEWHFIGHPQSNKVKYIAPFVHLVHGVDSLKLLKIINKEAQKNGRTIRCLLQFHIAREATKFGLTETEASAILNSGEYKALQNIQLVGVMGMATYTNDKAQIRKEFRKLHNIFDTLKKQHFAETDSFCELSMGMSDDFPLAIEEGSTMVRVGSKIFGARNY